MGDKGQGPQHWGYPMYGGYNPYQQFAAYEPQQFYNYYHGPIPFSSSPNGHQFNQAVQGPMKPFTPGGQLQPFSQEKNGEVQKAEGDSSKDLPPLPPGPPPPNNLTQPSPPGSSTPFYQLNNQNQGPVRFNMSRAQRPQFNQTGPFNNSGASKKKRKKKNKFNQQHQQGQTFSPALPQQMVRPPLPPQMKAPPLPPGPPPPSPMPPPEDVVLPPEPKPRNQLDLDSKTQQDWPKELSAYITKCYGKCQNDMDKDRVSIILKGKIMRATNDGNLWIKDWTNEPLPLLESEMASLNVTPMYKMSLDVPPKKRMSLVGRLGQRLLRSRSRSKSNSRSRSRSPPKGRPRNRRRKDRSGSSGSEKDWAPQPNIKKTKGRNLTLDKRGGKAKKGKGANIVVNLVKSGHFDDGVQPSCSSDIFSGWPIPKPLVTCSPLSLEKENEAPNSNSCHWRGHFYSEFGEAAGEVPVNTELLEKRAARFNSLGGGRRAKTNKGGTTVTFSNLNNSLLDVFEDSTGDFDLEDCHVVGVCQDIEKPYLRLTTAPEAAQVRPPDVLRQALLRVKERWVVNQDYHYACEQLKSIRQDLTVQGIRDKLTVCVYETHARIALEKGDHAEFNQCQSQLKLLNDELTTENKCEFTAYRILYFIFTKEYMDLNTAMVSLTAEDRNDECVRHALEVRSTWALGNYHRMFKLYRSAPRMSSYLMDWFLPRERKLALKTAVKAYRQTLPVSFLTEELAFPSDLLCREFMSQFGVVYADVERTKIDCKASSAAVASA